MNLMHSRGWPESGQAPGRLAGVISPAQLERLVLVSAVPEVAADEAESLCA
jgi:hypothetical protein